MIEVTTAALAAHPFLRGMQPSQVEALGAAASDVRFEPGQRIFEAGGYAGRFWLIQAGHIALDLRVQGEAVIVETVGIGDLLGWSWLFPPFTWGFGAIALSPVQAFEFDAAVVRTCCATDPVLDGEITRRVAGVMVRRLTAARTRLLATASRPEWA